jgi:hypothetical protein
MGLGHIQPLEMPVPFQSEIKSESIMDDDVEEIIRQPHMSSNNPWVPSYDSHIGSPTIMRDGDPFIKLYRQPEVQVGSPEMLMLR